MARIAHIRLQMVDLAPKVKRTDAIQSFVSQETPIVTITDADGAVGVGYSYTIGTGGSSVMRLLSDHLAPRLIGQEAEAVEAIWTDLEFHTHATTVGALTSIALAAVDTALWDLRCKRAGVPLWQMAGGAKPEAPCYTTEGGWLHLPAGALVQDALAAKEAGFKGSKVKIGKPSAAEDAARIGAIRDAVGPEQEIMVDANQGFLRDTARRRARALAEFDLGWLEEPLAADDTEGHADLARAAPMPIAVGESLYSIRHFADYVARGAASVIQVDAGRIGGITPWLKVAHMAECHGLAVAPHFLMELHASLVCAVRNGRWVENIPQLDEITGQGLVIQDGMAQAPMAPGIGIDWDIAEIDRRAVAEFTKTLGEGT